MAGSVTRLLSGALLGATLLALASCGPDRGSSVPVGGGPPAPIALTPSNSGVVFVPLDSPTVTTVTSAPTATAAPTATSAHGTPTTHGTPAAPTGTPSAPRPTGTPTSTAPQSPASLAVTALSTADTGQRWCQRVTLTLANSGDRTATSGTVTFSTHVIGALGVDWWTYRTSQSLAAPVPGHRSVDESWTVCLDSWRVPDGMHLETRAASLG